MRIAMDFPVNSENARIYVAPRSSGNVTTPNNFWGAVVGMDTGKVRIQTDSGTDVTVNIAQGAFGSVLNPTPFTRPGRATLTITNSSNVQILQRNVNYGYNEYVPVLYATDPIKSLTHTFPAGPAMISFPLQPLQPKAADALLDPVSGLPIFNDGNLLLAEWRQNQNKADGDNYLRYPVMDVLKPGRGYWENFAAATPVTVTGRVANVDQAVSTALLHGWNQIGSPYDAPVAVTDLLFQYLADNVPVDIATAITRGYIVAQNIPGSGLVTVFDFSPATGYTPATSLAPWKGYWIRVLVSEGVTITYPNPTGRSAHLTNRTSSRAADPPKGWSAALVVRSENGMASTAIIGQADGATAGYNSNLDAQRPPEFTRSVPIVSFNHADWGSNSGNYFSEIHSTGSATPWTVTVSVPDPAKQYTLSLGAITTIPIGTRLILEDTASGQKQYLLSSSGYRFTGGAATRAFKITVETRSYNSLRITSFNSRISRASGVVQMSYNLTEAALVSAEIRGADGRVIRRLASSRSANIGDNSIAWDGRDEKSTSVPSGSYLVHLTARTPEGDQARTIQTVTIVR
ncbi:MAG: FlgD immunoglobulin-like domain containing protein, partial [Chthonomonadales bacterium]